MPFGKGRYFTEGDHDARVVRVRQFEGSFVMDGVIKCAATGVLYLHSWSIDGASAAGEKPFNLSRPQPTSAAQ